MNFKGLNEKVKKFNEWNTKRQEENSRYRLEHEKKQAEFLQARSQRLKQEAEIARYEAKKRKLKQSYRPQPTHYNNGLTGFGSANLLGGSMFGPPPQARPKKRKHPSGRRQVIIRL